MIPKPLRERLNLGPGARVHLVEEEGRLLLTPERPEPRLLERDGFLVVDLGVEPPPVVQSGLGREERLRQLLDYALRR